MTDIIKEVEQLLDNMREPGFILTRKLVNEAKRLKVESENSEKIEHFATKTIERQSAEIEKKDIEIDILIRKKEALKDEVERLKAEAECADGYADALVERSKSEAIKEFAYKVKRLWANYEGYNFERELNNLVKEMVGDDK